MLAVFSRRTKIRKTQKFVGFLLQRFLETLTNTRLSKKGIMSEIQALQDLETLDSTKDKEPRANLRENFDLKDSTLAPREIARIGELLVEFYNIFARHRFEISMNEEFKVKLTTRDDSPVFRRSLSAPVKEDVLVSRRTSHATQIWQKRNTSVSQIC